VLPGAAELLGSTQVEQARRWRWRWERSIYSGNYWNIVIWCSLDQKSDRSNLCMSPMEETWFFGWHSMYGHIWYFGVLSVPLFSSCLNWPTRSHKKYAHVHIECAKTVMTGWYCSLFHPFCIQSWQLIKRTWFCYISVVNHVHNMDVFEEMAFPGKSNWGHTVYGDFLAPILGLGFMFVLSICQSWCGG
jgi:hypothetical protein